MVALPRNKSQKSVCVAVLSIFASDYNCAIKSLHADFGEFLTPDATNSPCTPSTSDMIGSIERDTEYVQRVKDRVIEYVERGE